MIELTKHGEKRIRKRHGLNRSAARRLVQEALQYGVPRTIYEGAFRRYLDKYYFPHMAEGTELFVYKHNLFIFRREILITSWAIPNKYRKAAKEYEK